MGYSPMNYSFGYSYYNQSTAIVNRWQQAGDIATYPTASSTSNTLWSNYLYYSDANWGDASYLKLKTASLNYSLPQKLIAKVGLSGLTFYVQGQNIFTWAKQKYTYDPESAFYSLGGMGTGNGRWIAYPPLRTIIVGFNLKF
jgi:hypothetical protein